MRSLRLFTAAVAALVGFAVLTPITSASAASPTIKASVSKPLANERFKISGGLGAKGERPVRLQRYSGGTWVTIKTRTSTSRGGYSFTGLTIAAATKFRAYAPAARVNGVRVDSRKTRTLAVGYSGTTQTITIDSLPAIYQSVDSTQRVSTATTAKGYVRATFTPARPGRSVTVTPTAGGSSYTRTQDSRGQVRILSSQAQASWKVTAHAYNGAAAAVREAQPAAWSSAFTDEFTNGAHGKWTDRYPSAWLPGRTCSYISPGQVKQYGTGGISLGTQRHKANTQPSLSQAISPKPSRSKFLRKCKDMSGSARVYAGSALTSKPFTFSYGVAAARIRFDTLAGQNGAFWLQFIGRKGTEIDVIESGGLKGSTPMRTGIHQVHSDGSTSAYSTKYSRSSSWYSKYHVVSVEWTPRAYIFRLDGNEVYRTSRGPDSAPHEIVLSNIVPDWAIARNNGKPSKMVVDWVRAWQH